ncbi:hypothetical protein PV433_11560 [Paenibacillus sp. GYB004]|uniref:hypothetical protein n=1 Tax=Paenibacillus sp. GYB004 TaxID=2994393 RepID=UPI002F96B067
MNLDNGVGLVSYKTDDTPVNMVHMSGNQAVFGSPVVGATLHSSVVPSWWNGSVLRNLIHTGGSQSIGGETQLHTLRMVGDIVTAPSAGNISSVASGRKFEVIADANHDAYMSFHVASNFAYNFGMSANDHRLRVGGWSLGNTDYRVWDERDFKVGTTAPANPVVGAIWIDTSV